MRTSAKKNLLLARHGESTFNRDNRFTGWIDAPLTEQGRREAKDIAAKLDDLEWDKAYTSNLSRAIESLNIVLAETHHTSVSVIKTELLNERFYGDLQGLNKDETAERYGVEQVRLWRRSYDVAPPHGESLKDTALRVLPYFHSEILQDIRNGHNVLVLAHGNSLRAIIKELDHLTDGEIVGLNIATGEVRRYIFNREMHTISHAIL
jgi:2,3-bisphosphoglycerate-dependent phosphoglycerate mutase